MLSPTDGWRDLRNGLRTAAAVVPTSMAVAFACGLPVTTGLVAAFVGGGVAALVGSTPFTIVGPVVFLAPLVASAQETFGARGLVALAVGCGILQTLFGLFNVGHWLRVVPASVVGGFTAGVGATVVVAEAPHLLGLPAPDSRHLIDVVTHAVEYLARVQPKEALVASITLVAALLFSRGLPTWPGRLLALLVGTLAAHAMRLDVQMLQGLSSALPSPRLVSFPRGDLFAFAGWSCLLFVVASAQSSIVTDGITARAGLSRRDRNGDLVGMGVANLLSGLFGAMPVAVGDWLTRFHTGTGVRSRRSTLFGALIVGAAALFLPRWIGYVPVAAVSALLVVFASRLVDWRDFRETLATSRADGLVYALTFLLVLLVDLVAGAQVGVLAALVAVALRLGRLDVLLFSNANRGPYRIRMDGSMTFLSTESLATLRARLAPLDRSRGVILELSDVGIIDGTGADALRALVADLVERGWTVALLGLNAEGRRQLESADVGGNLAKAFVATEADAQARFQSPSGDAAYDRLSAGVTAFRARRNERFELLFDELAEGQRPHTLFITCADSRIQPNLITSTHPGELFLVRNVGNLVPPYVATDASPAEYAAVEYGILALGVTQIVVCGHSSCGAMKAILGGNIPPALDSVRRWIQSSFRPEELESLRQAKTPEEAAQRNAALQLEHLVKHPLVAERLAAGTVRVTAWFYDIGAGEILEYDRNGGAFRPLS